MIVSVFYELGGFLMKKVTLVLVVLFLVGILAGCGQTGEKWEALTEEGIILL